MLKLRLDLAINYYGVPVTLPTQTYLLGEKASQHCGGSQAGGGSGVNGKTRRLCAWRKFGSMGIKINVHGDLDAALDSLLEQMKDEWMG